MPAREAGCSQVETVLFVLFWLSVETATYLIGGTWSGIVGYCHYFTERMDIKHDFMTDLVILEVHATKV